MPVEVSYVNEGTQTPIAVDSIGGTAYIQAVKINMGANGVDGAFFEGTISDISKLSAGTITRLEGGTISTNMLSGSVVVTTGTIAVIPNIPGGTVGLVTRISTIGTLEVGTISTLPNIPGGTLGVVTSITGVASGTINSSGTVTGVGVVTSVTEVANLAKGTITKVEGGTIGLITRVGNVGTLEVGTITTMPNIPGGTVGVVSMLSAGTVTRVEGGSIAITAGTVAISAGTLQTHYAEDAGHTTADKGELVFAVRNDGGTSLVGSDLDYTALSTDANGNLRILGTIPMINAGTITSVGTVPGVGVVSMLTAGTVSMINAGTITSVGTVPGVGVVTSVTEVANLAKGTITKVEGGTLGVVTSVTEVANLAKGTITKLEGGTLGVVSSLSAGTITKLEGGTLGILAQGSINVTAGTVTAGTLTRLSNVGTLELGTVKINPRPTRDIFTFGTVTTGTIGTLVAAPGAATAIYVQNVSVQVYNGTAETLVSFGLSTTGGGATGGGPLVRGNYVGGGGQDKAFSNAVNGATTNVALTYNILSGAGTVAYQVSYWVE